jgi:hypothetical protein
MTMSTSPLRLLVEGDRVLIAREAPTLRVVEVVIRAPETSSGPQRRIPLNLALVLDRSGSMYGEKLHYILNAAASLIETLGEEDHLAVVIFNHRVSVLSRCRPTTKEYRRYLIEALGRIEAKDLTFLSEGWIKGYEVLHEAHSPLRFPRILLFSDGLANIGDVHPRRLGIFARNAARFGASTSIFGVGRNVNEELLRRMADMGYGNFYFIEKPQDIPRFIAQELEHMANITARDVELALDIPNGVTVRVYGDWWFTQQDGRLRLFVGNLEAGRVQRLYLEIITPSATEATDLNLAFRVSARDRAGGVWMTHADLRFVYAAQSEVAAAPYNSGLLARFARYAHVHPYEKSPYHEQIIWKIPTRPMLPEKFLEYEIEVQERLGAISTRLTRDDIQRLRSRDLEL